MDNVGPPMNALSNRQTTVSLLATATGILWGLGAGFLFVVTLVFVPLPTSIPLYMIAVAFAGLAIAVARWPRLPVLVCSLLGGLVVLVAAGLDAAQNPDNVGGAFTGGLYGFGIVVASTVLLLRGRRDHSS